MSLPACTVCQAEAAWSCSACGPKCAAHVLRKRGIGIRFTCAKCNQPAELQRVRRSDIATFRERVIHALTTGLLGYPIIAILVCAVLFALTSVIGMVGGMVGVAFMLPLGLAIMRAAADGEPFDIGRISDPVEDLAVPLARALATCWPALVAVALVFAFVVNPWELGSSTHSLPVALLMSLTFWAAFLFSVAYVPLALLQATIAPGWGAAFNPIAVVKPIRKWWNEYRWLALIAGAGTLVTMLFALLSVWLTHFGPLLAGVSAALTGMGLMRVIGELIYLHPAAFEWGDADDGWIDLGDPNAPALEEAAVPVAPTKTAIHSAEGLVRAALDAKDAKLAVKIYLETPDAEAQLSQATLTRVGQAAASLEEYKLAISALLAAARENVPESGKPLILSAMILDERLRDHGAAKRLYLQVIERFPGTIAADRAQRELADPRFIIETRAG